MQRSYWLSRSTDSQIEAIDQPFHSLHVTAQCACVWYVQEILSSHILFPQEF